MNTALRPSTLALTALLGGLLLADSATAWYGGSWYRPLGAGAMTYERQNMMRGHGYVMSELAAMIEGRRAFNSTEAARLARELESGFGDELSRNYAPGAVVAGSRTAPWTWSNFGAFQGYAEAARHSAGSLAGALEKADDSGVPATARPAPGVRPTPPTGPRMAHMPPDAVQAYSRLTAACHSCHMSFRGPRW
jgi:cytochrome c556